MWKLSCVSLLCYYNNEKGVWLSREVLKMKNYFINNLMKSFAMLLFVFNYVKKYR